MTDFFNSTFRIYEPRHSNTLQQEIRRAMTAAKNKKDNEIFEGRFTLTADMADILINAESFNADWYAVVGPIDTPTVTGEDYLRDKR